jgi:hypothetical protein
MWNVVIDDDDDDDACLGLIGWKICIKAVRKPYKSNNTFHSSATGPSTSTLQPALPNCPGAMNGHNGAERRLKELLGTNGIELEQQIGGLFFLSLQPCAQLLLFKAAGPTPECSERAVPTRPTEPSPSKQSICGAEENTYGGGNFAFPRTFPYFPLSGSWNARSG